MAQPEDTELRDLVIEALEKNGSLAKIRALLRANIFLIFEDERENIKQNVSLDNILSLTEGALCLSIVHEFLEFCNLKNSLFVYMSESRQRKEYIYEGQKKLSEKLHLSRKDNIKEPILLTILKQSLSASQRKYLDTNDKTNENHLKDDQNCTYIVHEDSSSSATSTSHSDNSSDEKNKLQLRLQLDNSDTDTSSDSARDKSSSEYIPNEHIITEDMRQAGDNNLTKSSMGIKHENYSNIYKNHRSNTNYLRELKLITNNSSSDSTSYIDLKPYNPLDQKLLNTPGVPIIEADEKDTSNPITLKKPSSKSLNEENVSLSNAPKLDSLSSETLSSGSLKNEEVEDKTNHRKASIEGSQKSDVESAEYSNDFISSPVNKNKETVEKTPGSPASIQDEYEDNALKNSSLESPHQTSRSSHSSVSISDVADLISEKSLSISNQTNNDRNLLANNKLHSSSSKLSNKDKSKMSDDSAEFSESPIPSLSNLSLDIHSD